MLFFQTCLKKETFLETGKSYESMHTWEERMVEISPTFMFWNMIIRYQTLILLFVRAHREQNFKLYVNVMDILIPLFFVLDHINYARWLPVHLRDMRSLPDTIRIEFEENGHWDISKTSHKFSTMSLDQAHEQENKIVKSSGGAVGLTENPVAFRYDREKS